MNALADLLDIVARLALLGLGGVGLVVGGGFAWGAVAALVRAPLANVDLFIVSLAAALGCAFLIGGAMCVLTAIHD